MAVGGAARQRQRAVPRGSMPTPGGHDARRHSQAPGPCGARLWAGEHVPAARRGTGGRAAGPADTSFSNGSPPRDDSGGSREHALGGRALQKRRPRGGSHDQAEHARCAPRVNWGYAALMSAACWALLAPSSAQHVPPPSQLVVSNFQYTILNTSWVDSASNQSSVASYDLRWRPTGASTWLSGREIQAPGSSYEITGSTLVTCS